METQTQTSSDEKVASGHHSVGPRVPTALHKAIRQVTLDTTIPAFDKRRRITEMIMQELGKGFFCRTHSELFYFSKSERRLFDLDQRPFQHYLSALSGLSATEVAFRFSLDMLQTEAAQRQPVIVHTLAHFDPGTSRLVVSDGGGGLWIREHGGEWVRCHNGENGLLFFTDPDAVRWEPEFNVSEGSLNWYLKQFLLGDHPPLKRDEQRTLYLVKLLQDFFPEIRRTRLIPAFLGAMGSGKSTAERLTGRLLVGPAFDVTKLHREKEDAFIASTTNQLVCAIDNADVQIPWLEDSLACYATNLRFKLRRLYHTNELASYEPRAILMISSRDPHFKRPDVAERLLPLYCQRPEKYLSEDVIFSELAKRRSAIMGSLLYRVGKIADSLQGVEAPPLPFRMADFAAFGWKVFKSVGRESEWTELLGHLELGQAGFAGEDNSIVMVLRNLLERDGTIGPIEVGELFGTCTSIAEAKSLRMPRTPQGFGRVLTNTRRVIELELNVKFSEEFGHQSRRFITIVPVKSEGSGK